MIGKGERLFTLVFGIFLAGVGVYALLMSEADIAWRLGGGVALLLLGGNMIYASWQGKSSWLSRLGPLP